MVGVKHDGVFAWYMGEERETRRNGQHVAPPSLASSYPSRVTNAGIRAKLREAPRGSLRPGITWDCW